MNATDDTGSVDATGPAVTGGPSGNGPRSPGDSSARIGPGSPDDSPAPVGFIGLGNMGAPIARRLLAWPGGLVVCDVRAEATEPFVAEGATAAATPEEVARTAELISVTVLDDAQVRDVVDGPNGILRSASPGTVIAIHSTISDSTAVELAEVCAAAGVHLIDAPVSGGAPGAEQGELAVMVGGPREVYDACKPAFTLWAGMPVHAGEVGAGTRMKLARNLLHFISFTATAEAARLAEAAGIDIAKLGRVVRHTDAITGGAGAVMLRDTTAPIASGDFWHGVFTHVRGLGEKDLSLALGLADRLGVDLPLGTIALRDLGAGFGVGPGEIALAAGGGAGGGAGAGAGVGSAAAPGASAAAGAGGPGDDDDTSDEEIR